MSYIDKLAWIELRDGAILSTRSKGKDAYYIPGGKREAGESDHQALIREIKEELSVELIADELRYWGTFQAQAHGKAPGVEVRMTCYTGGYRGTLRPDHEIAEVVWLSYADRENCSPVDQVIFDYLRKQGFW